MKELLKHFPTATKRPYRGGTEVRVNNLDEALVKARRIIDDNKLRLEIFDISSQLRSFSVRTKNNL